MERADIIYIFTSPDKPGIQFYDRSPSGAVAKFAGTLSAGKFQTDRYSISKAIWDAGVNSPNSSQLLRYNGDDVKVTTYMVSEKKLFELISSIIAQIKQGHRELVVDISEQKDIEDEQHVIIERLEQLKQDFLNAVQGPKNKMDYTDNEIDEIVRKNKK